MCIRDRERLVVLSPFSSGNDCPRALPRDCLSCYSHTCLRGSSVSVAAGRGRHDSTWGSRTRRRRPDKGLHCCSCPPRWSLNPHILPFCLVAAERVLDGIDKQWLDTVSYTHLRAHET